MSDLQPSTLPTPKRARRAQPWVNRIVGYGEEAPDQLLANPKNWRIHPKPQQDALSGVLHEVGVVQNILVNRTTGNVVDGHLRVALAISENQPLIPVTYVELSEAEEAEILATLDPLAAMAATDKDQLEALLREVSSGDDAVTAMLADMAAKSGIDYGKPVGEDPGAQIDRAEELREKWQTERGQLWVIPSLTVPGREHRLLCGDSTSGEDVARLMGGELAAAAFTSPPYAEQRKEQYGGTHETKYVEWFGTVQEQVVSALVDNGCFFVNIKPHSRDGERSLYVLDLVSSMCREWGWRFVDELCWLHEDLPGAWPNRFRNGFESIYHFARTGHFTFNPKAVGKPSSAVPNGRGGLQHRDGGNWTLSAPLVNGIAQPSNVLRLGGNTDSVSHAAAFPVALPEFFQLAYSHAGDIWMDPFIGSGTAMVAAEQLARVCYGMEIEPKYIAVILERMAGMGLEPRLSDG